MGIDVKFVFRSVVAEHMYDNRYNRSDNVVIRQFEKRTYLGATGHKVNDYTVLKSSREALLRMAGFKEGPPLFNTGSLNQIREEQVEGEGRDADSSGDHN